MRRHASVSRLRFAALLASSSVAALLIGGGKPASAAFCAILQDTGTVPSLTNTAPNLNCIYVTNGAGVAGDITNTGGIGSSGSLRDGIIIDQSASVGGSIINSGTINGAAGMNVGIYVHDGATLLGDISNGGTISGAPVGLPPRIGGIVVTSAAQFGTGSTGGNIINSGTISLSVATGIVVQNVSSVGSISNSGTISTTGAWGILVGTNVVQQFRHDHQPRHRHFCSSRFKLRRRGHKFRHDLWRYWSWHFHLSKQCLHRRHQQFRCDLGPGGRPFCNRRFLLRRLHQLRHDHDGRGRHWP
jgi:hypothetical protein